MCDQCALINTDRMIPDLANLRRGEHRYELNGLPLSKEYQMTKKQTIREMLSDTSWMTNGTPVVFCPPTLMCHNGGKPFHARIEGLPFLMGNPKNSKWVVRLVDLDENYQSLFRRSAYSCADVRYVFPRREE